jgi:hypothetical protein
MLPCSPLAQARPACWSAWVGGHRRQFRRLAQVARRELPVGAPNLRGHRLSGWVEPWNLEVLVEVVLETVAAEGVGPASTVEGRKACGT